MNIHDNYSELREAYYGLTIDDTEAVWIKKLRNILNEDIHERPLGCKINNTHIKIGDVHLGAFFEAQILFSHAKWNHRFANWLSMKIAGDIQKNESILIVGYETYLEPVLSMLCNALLKQNRHVEYCIYEEPRYIQRSEKSNPRIRYVEDICKHSERFTRLVFLCGISSTLNTFKKVSDLLFTKLETLDKNTIHKSYYSIIQVLPTTNKKNKFTISQERVLSWNKRKKQAECNGIRVEYLVDVECEWQKAKCCKWCFPTSQKKDVLYERPLIITGDSSVIPQQMIGGNGNHGLRAARQLPQLDLMKKGREGFVYSDYLYYNHTDRDDHHYQYYFRTGALFNHIINNQKDLSFNDFCQSIKEGLENKLDDINIIIMPQHFSNERFPNEINRRVFDNKAHMIAFNPKKEFRSNFETKYSNYVYVIDQAMRDISNNQKKINFYFVDDQLITGQTYYRAKSFVTSLLSRYRQQNPKEICRIFAAVIILLDRNSTSTRMNYVDDINQYYSYINVSIPSIRSYGDSCPLCKQVMDANEIASNCTLSWTTAYWNSKAEQFMVKTIENVKREAEDDQKHRPWLQQRHYHRFFCESALWNRLKNTWGDDEILYNEITEIIARSIKGIKAIDQYEYLISFIRVMSRPFLFYRENIKKAVLKIMLKLIEAILSGKEFASAYVLVRTALSAKTIKASKGTNRSSINPDSLKFEKYSLLCALISSLSDIGSNYLLSPGHIDSMCSYVESLDGQYNTFAQLQFTIGKVTIEQRGFYAVLTHSLKRLICSASGREKTAYFNKTISKKITGKQQELYKTMLLESIIRTDDMQDREIRKKAAEIEKSILRKYQAISETIARDSLSCTFFLEDGHHDKRIYEISENYSRAERWTDLVGPAENEEQIEHKLKSMKFWDNGKDVFLFHLAGNHQKNVYMRIMILHDSAPTFRAKYDNIKQCIIHRATLQVIIDKDIENGALDSAIKAKAAEAILRTDKTESHGQSSDINRLYDLVKTNYDQALRRQEEGDEHPVNSAKEKNRQFFWALDTINLFMNRCIALGATKEIVEENFGVEYNGTQLLPFRARMQKIKEGQHIEERLRLYFQEICSDESEYIELIRQQIIKKLQFARKQSIQDKKITITINGERFSDSSPVLKSIRKIQYVPTFIDLPSKAIMNDMMLLGILDVFIRNAIEHGPAACAIDISWKFGNEAIATHAIRTDPQMCYDQSYSFEVTNFSDKECSREHQSLNPRKGEGFTKIFLTKHLVKLREEQLYFLTEMGEQHQGYQAKLICVVPQQQKVSI